MSLSEMFDQLDSQLDPMPQVDEGKPPLESVLSLSRNPHAKPEPAYPLSNVVPFIASAALGAVFAVLVLQDTVATIVERLIR